MCVGFEGGLDWALMSLRGACLSDSSDARAEEKFQKGRHLIMLHKTAKIDYDVVTIDYVSVTID